MFLRAVFEWRFNCFGILNVGSPAENTFDRLLGDRLLELGRLRYERLRGDGLRGRCLRAVNCVFTMRNVSLGSEFSELTLAKRTGYAVVWDRRNLRCKLVDLLRSAAILHCVTHFAGDLNGFLKLVRLLTPLRLFFFANLLSLTLMMDT